MTVLSSVQTAADGQMSWGTFLVMFGAMLLLASSLLGAWLLAQLEDRTRYDEVEDTYPTEQSSRVTVR